MGRKDRLLKRLAARLDHNGKPKKEYRESVAHIRAELAMYDEQAARVSKEAEVGSTDAS